MTWNPQWLAFALTATFGVAATALAQPTQAEPPAKNEPKAEAPDLFGLGGAARAAADLRRAGEALDSFGSLMKDIVPPVATAISEMSSGFDPFGYKAAFQTIAAQNEIIREQNQTIQELLRGDIARLQWELSEAKGTTKQQQAAKAKKRKKRS